MLFGILWDLIPEKIPEAIALYEQNKVKYPKGLEVLGKWLHSENKCIEVVEAEDSDLVTKYTKQFDKYATYEIIELTDAREVIPNLPF